MGEERVYKMRVGSIVLSSYQGLGILAKSFYDNGIIQETLVKRSGRFKNHPEWFDNKVLVGNPNSDFEEKFEKKDLPEVVDFLSKIDVLLLFEIPFVKQLITLAKQMGVKVALMPMYECTPYPLEADLYICPSVLDEDYYKKMYPKGNVTQINVPVQVDFKLRERAHIFVHNAGNGGTFGRNGTKEILEAMKYVKSPIKLILRTQKNGYTSDDPRIEIVTSTVSYDELWSKGDVFLFPEKFNGLSLPLQEAHGCGMLVMTGNRRPNNVWLPQEPLIPVDREHETKIVNVKFQMSEFDPRKIAEKIDHWYGKDITEFSMRGKAWAEVNSWETLRPVYLDSLRRI